jgi:hypothetical protein
LSRFHSPGSSEFFYGSTDGKPIDTELFGKPGLAGELVSGYVRAIVECLRDCLTYAFVQWNFTHGETLAG